MVVVSRVVAAALLVCVWTACSSGNEVHPGPNTDYAPIPVVDGGDAGPFQRHEAGASCTDFAKEDCSIDLGVVNGVHNCTPGVQICEKGVWSDCLPP
jgi:hypothetical protein